LLFIVVELLIAHHSVNTVIAVVFPFGCHCQYKLLHSHANAVVSVVFLLLFATVI